MGKLTHWIIIYKCNIINPYKSATCWLVTRRIPQLVIQKHDASLEIRNILTSRIPQVLINHPGGWWPATAPVSSIGCASCSIFLVAVRRAVCTLTAKLLCFACRAVAKNTWESESGRGLLDLLGRKDGEASSGRNCQTSLEWLGLFRI